MQSHSVRDAAASAAPRGPAHSGLCAEVVRRDSIDAAGVDGMYSLYSANYLDTSAELFRSDLAKKTHALILRNAAGQLCGFSTVQLYSSSVDGRKIRVVYSGDTIIAPAYWGSQALAYEWLRFAGEVQRMAPEQPLYWLLIVKGHRTYRFLPAFARTYVPHYADSAEGRNATGCAGSGEHRLREALAKEKFGSLYDAATGVVRFPSCMGRLRPNLADVPERHLRSPDVTHFLTLNPGYRNGDELVCLCRLSRENLRPRAAKIFSQDRAEAVLN